MQVDSNLPPCTPDPKILKIRPSQAWSCGLSGPSLPLDYFTDYSGGAMFALARAKEAEPGPPQLGALMKLRSFDRCALNAIVAYRSYAGGGKHGKTMELVMNDWI